MARKKTCPECAERIQVDARVCRHCGHRFDEAPTTSTDTHLIEKEPQVEEAPSAQPGTSEPLFEKKKERNESNRWIILSIVSILGGLAVAYADRDCGKSVDPAYAIGSVFGAGLTACLFALIGMLFQRLRKRPVDFKHSLLSFWVIGFLIFSVLTSAAKNNSDREDKCDNTSTSSSTAPVAPVATPLGQKLLGQGPELSTSDGRTEIGFYNADTRMRNALTRLIAAYNDNTVSVQAFVADVDGAQAELNSDLNILNQSVTRTHDPEVQQFLGRLPPARTTEIQGLNALAAAVRSGTNADVETARQALNQGASQSEAWHRQFLQQIKPYQ